MGQAFKAVRKAIKADNKAQARLLLKPILKNEPSAEAWYWAARAMETDEQAIKCLREALQLDEFHTQANRLLHQLEGAIPLHEQEKERQRELELAKRVEHAQPLAPIERQKKPDRFQRHAARQKTWARLGCIASLMLSVSCSLFAFGAIGLLPGFIGTMTTLFGGPEAVTEIEGTPIEKVPDAPVLMTPSQSDQASDQAVDIMDHGYLHEYTFDAGIGQTYAVYVQFLSVSANKVNRNVVVLDPNGWDATSQCERDSILEDNSGVTYICSIDVTGQWKVRVLGRNGESVGVYFVGVQKMRF